MYFLWMVFALWFYIVHIVKRKFHCLQCWLLMKLIIFEFAENLICWIGIHIHELLRNEHQARYMHPDYFLWNQDTTSIWQCHKKYSDWLEVTIAFTYPKCKRWKMLHKNFWIKTMTLLFAILLSCNCIHAYVYSYLFPLTAMCIRSRYGKTRNSNNWILLAICAKGYSIHTWKRYAREERCGKSSGEIKMTTAVYTVLSVPCSTDIKVTGLPFSINRKGNTLSISINVNKYIFNKAFYISCS